MSATNNLLKVNMIDVTTKKKTARYSLFQSNARLWMSLILIFSDTIALLLSFLIAVNIRLGSLDSLDKYFYVDFIWVPVILSLIIQGKSGLYPGIGVSAVEEFRRLSVSNSLLFLIIFSITFLLKTADYYSRLLFLLAWMLTLFLMPIARNIMRWVSVKLKIWGEQVAVVGFPDRRVAEVADFFVKFPHKGIRPKVIFTESGDDDDHNSPYHTHSAQKIGDCPHSFGIKTVLVVVPNWNWVGENIDRYRYLFERVILIQNQHGNFSLSDSVALDFYGVMGFEVRHNLLNPWSMLYKRVIDLAVSALSLLILSPFLALLIFLIRIDSPGGVFYRQDRLGKGGKVFKVLKFRTMHINADEILSQCLKENKALQDEWRKYQKLKADPRITRIGSFVRKYSLDELPQLWNILKGEMSLVGPRPIMVSQKQMYGLGFNDYSQIRPGITGLWQVSGRNRTTFARRAELDLEYIQRWSIWLDIYIIFQTFKEVVSKDGAY